MEGRRQAIHAVAALKRFMPGCEDAKLRNFGMTLGIRDTRKVDAHYNLTADDVREQGRFEDSIGGDKTSHAAVRNMMCCAVSGQGAGVAAAMSIRTGRSFDALDI